MEDLTSKQRAQLRGLANSIDTILHVGKDGIGDNLVKQADDALEARGREAQAEDFDKTGAGDQGLMFGPGAHQGQGPGEQPAEQPGGGRGPGIGHPEPGGTGDWNQIRFVSSNP